MTEKIIVICGVSTSGKTTLLNELLDRGRKKPLNFTTRMPRTKEALIELVESRRDWKKEREEMKYEDFHSDEFDEYIFTNRVSFAKKENNGDFLETTKSYGERYGVSRFLPDGKVAIVLDPVGRAQVMEYLSRLGMNVETYYLEISKDIQSERLAKRGGTEKSIIERKRDYDWFYPTNKCKRLNGTKPISELADIIESNL